MGASPDRRESRDGQPRGHRGAAGGCVAGRTLAPRNAPTPVVRENMDFDLPEELVALRGAVARFATDQIAPYAQEWDRNNLCFIDLRQNISNTFCLFFSEALRL